MRQLSILMLTVLAATGCTQRPLFLQPRPLREWPATLQAVKEAARAGRYAQADSVLAGFESRYPTSYEGREAAYWRALLLADPANAQASPAEAVRAINRYFAGRSTAETYDEATILRRILQRADSVTREIARAERLIAEAQEAAAEPRPAAAPAAAATPATTRETRNLVEQVRRLRDELSQANQELERVRRRLSGQRP
jgi:outer membrane protein assembly factor BamD (BamD/ComL family)